MPRTRPAYPAEFRERLLELHRAGRTAAQLAAEFEPSEQTIKTWIAQATKTERPDVAGTSHDEREELKRLRKEVRQLRLEREILSKAAAWFARESNALPGGSSNS